MIVYYHRNKKQLLVRSTKNNGGTKMTSNTINSNNTINTTNSTAAASYKESGPIAFVKRHQFAAGFVTGAVVAAPISAAITDAHVTKREQKKWLEKAAEYGYHK